MIDCCIDNYNTAQREEAYNIYVTDTLRLLSENVAKIAGGKYIKQRYFDIVKDEKKPADIPENKTPKELVNDVITRAGIKVVKS